VTAPPGSSVDHRPAPIDCETAVRRLWDFLDGRLPPWAHAEVEEHLATCELCPPHFLFAQSIRDALAASAAPAAAEQGDAESADVRALRDRVRRALRAENAGSGGHTLHRNEESY
jgi:anti-sigma factor RsiW